MSYYITAVVALFIGYLIGNWPAWNKGYKDGFEKGRERYIKTVDKLINSVESNHVLGTQFLKALKSEVNKVMEENHNDPSKR